MSQSAQSSNISFFIACNYATFTLLPSTFTPIPIHLPYVIPNHQLYMLYFTTFIFEVPGLTLLPMFHRSVMYSSFRHRSALNESPGLVIKIGDPSENIVARYVHSYETRPPNGATGCMQWRGHMHATHRSI